MFETREDETLIDCLNIQRPETDCAAEAPRYNQHVVIRRSLV